MQMASCCFKSMVSLRTSMFRGTNFNTYKRSYSIESSSLHPPDVARLADTARISLSPQEVQEFGPKIQQVVDWFGQLQAVDLESIEPTIRSDIDGDNLREDLPQTFENREAIISSIPSYEEPYIKVPKVLHQKIFMHSEFSDVVLGSLGRAISS